MSDNLMAILRAYLEAPSVVLNRSDRLSLGGLLARQVEPGRDFKGTPLRVSGLGKCSRALSYGLSQVEKDGRSIDARARMVFSMGDMVEALVAVSLREALRPTTWSLSRVLQDQETVTLRVEMDPAHPDGLVLDLDGHPDGLIHRTLPGLGSQLAGVLEVKSMSSYAFSRCEETAAGPTGEPWGPEDGYWWQVQGYMAATGAPRAYVVAICKDSGAMAGWWLDAAPGHFMTGLRAHLARVVHSPPGEASRMLPGGEVLAPEVNLHKTRGTPNKSHGTLPWQCRYCAYFRPCWSPYGLEETVGRDWRGRPSTVLKVTSWTGEDNEPDRD